MGTVALRVFIYSVLPLIMAVGHLGLDKGSRSRERKLEVFLLYLLGVGVAGSGIGGFFGHMFISDSVAESIGWPTGSPFQLEVGFANLAIGILGIVASLPSLSSAWEPPSSISAISSRPAIWHQVIPFRTSAIFSNQHCSSVYLLPAGGRNARLPLKLMPQALTHGAGLGSRLPV